MGKSQERNDKMKEELKDVALKYGEKGAELAIDFVFELINVAVIESENKLDDAFLPTLNSLKPIAMALAEQIYKEEL